MPDAAVNGTTLRYHVAGDGPPWLVLHGGLGLDNHLYQRTLAPLSTDRTVVFYDHRSNGRSGRPPLPSLTMRVLADDAVALADHLGFDRFSILGHSYGGFIAQQLAIDHADRIDQLVLVATTPGQPGRHERIDPTPEPEPPAVFLDAIAGPSMTAAEHAGWHHQLVPYYLYRADPDPFAALLRETVFDPAAMARGFEILAHWSAVDRLHRVTCPTMLICGRHDTFTAPSQVHRIARHLPDATTSILDDAGHFPWVDQPGPFFDTINQFTERGTHR